MRMPSDRLATVSRLAFCLPLLALGATPASVHAQGASTGIDEILVTARKREERLIDVPVSVAALGGPQLEQNFISDVDNLIGKVPSLYFSSNVLSPGKDFVNLVIRGVGAQSAGTPAVATIVDGVYVPALSFDIEFMDVERVEVLRGPQGTLFGRNTQGGALNIVLRRPDEEAQGRIALTYDEFNTMRAQGGVSGPLSDRVFGAVSVDFESSDGYLKNPVIPALNGDTGTVDANDDRRIAGRAALRFKPNDALDINVAVDASNRKGLDGLPGVPRGTTDYIVRSEFQVDAEYENYGGAVTIDYDFDTAALTSITGYRKVTSSLPFDFDGSPEFTDNYHDLSTSQSILSQELRLAGTASQDRLKWLAGIYAFDEKHFQDRDYALNTVPIFPNGIFIDAQDQRLKRHGIAGFADLSYTFFDQLDVGAGIRYSWEKAKANTAIDFTIPNLFGPGADLRVAGAAEERMSESAFTPSASIAYRWTTDLTTYARYARGYKAGGFPLAPADPSAVLAFDSEKSDNFELGMKASLFDGRLRFDGAVYHIDIKNQQVSTIVFLNGNPNLPVAAVANAGKSSSKGFEFSLDANPLDDLTLSWNIGYTDAKYKEYVDTAGLDRAGERFPFVPKWTTQISADYRVPLTSSLDIGLNASYRYVDDILSGSGVDIDVQFPVKSYDVVDLRASLIAENWKLDLFVENLFDDFIETRVFNAFFFLEPRPFSIVLPPRRVGARFTYDF